MDVFTKEYTNKDEKKVIKKVIKAGKDWYDDKDKELEGKAGAKKYFQDEGREGGVRKLFPLCLINKLMRIMRK